MQFVKQEIMKRVKTSMNADLFITVGEINDLPSETVPDQSMTIREIMARYARGLPLDGRVTLYEPDEGEYADDLDQMTKQEFDRLDLSEQQELIDNRRQELADIKRRENDDKRRKASSHKRMAASPKNTGSALPGNGGDAEGGEESAPSA